MRVALGELRPRQRRSSDVTQCIPVGDGVQRCVKLTVFVPDPTYLIRDKHGDCCQPSLSTNPGIIRPPTHSRVDHKGVDRAKTRVVNGKFSQRR